MERTCTAKSQRRRRALSSEAPKACRGNKIRAGEVRPKVQEYMYWWGEGKKKGKRYRLKPRRETRRDEKTNTQRENLLFSV